MKKCENGKEEKYNRHNHLKFCSLPLNSVHEFVKERSMYDSNEPYASSGFAIQR